MVPTRGLGRALVTVCACATALGAHAMARGSGAGAAPSGAVPHAHECVPPSAARTDVRIAWHRLRNPVFALDRMTKDQTVRWVDGRWHLLFSERTANGETGTGHATSRDLATWTVASLELPGDGSPDLTRRDDGSFVLTVQHRDPTDPEISRISFRTTDTLDGPWSDVTRLAAGVFDDERTIDAALAHTDHGLFLLFKRGLHTSTDQHDEVAYSPSGSLDGPWALLGEPDLPSTENFQVLPIDGVWHLLATTIPVHEPTLFRLVGDPRRPKSWLHWKKVRTFRVPEERWNRSPQRVLPPGIAHERANSAYLCDARSVDGYWYLLYAGSTELESFEGRGHAQIGIARSRDLKRWDVPGG